MKIAKSNESGGNILLLEIKGGLWTCFDKIKLCSFSPNLVTRTIRHIPPSTTHTKLSVEERLPSITDGLVRVSWDFRNEDVIADLKQAFSYYSRFVD
jgi:O-acetylhomoserine/O-acetylserine sulfhydrylase-like pyridoxal-dependent enzyme